MDEQIKGYVSEAIDCIDKESGDFKLLNENIQRYREIKDILIEELPLDIEDLRISERNFSNKLWVLLTKLKSEDKPQSKFDEEFGKLKADISQSELTNYTIVFPLNLKYGVGLNPHDFSVYGKEIEFLPRDELETNFLPQIEDDDDFEDFINKSPNQIDSFRDNFWKVEYRARDEFFAVEEIEKLLEILLGKINYAVKYGFGSGWHINKSIWPDRGSRLRHPFAYFVFKNEEFESLHYDDDVSKRKKLKISGQSKKERYREIFKELPTLSPSNEIDQKLASAFRAFQRGITEPNIRKSFLEFWRGLEILTMVSEKDSTVDVVNRTKPLRIVGHPETYEDRTNHLVNKRNNYVHEGMDVRITKRNIDLTKLLLEGLLDFVLDFRGEFSEQDFDFVLENFTTREEGKIKNLNDLTNSKKKKEEELERQKRDLELLQKMIDWKK